MRRLLLRGLQGAKIEYLLACITHNLGKMVSDSRKTWPFQPGIKALRALPQRKNSRPQKKNTIQHKMTDPTAQPGQGNYRLLDGLEASGIRPSCVRGANGWSRRGIRE